MAALGDPRVGPKIKGLAVAPYTISKRRTRKLRSTASATFSLSEDAHVAGGLDPVGAPKGRAGIDLAIDGKRGGNSIRVAARNLDAGRYKLWLTAEDYNGNESDTATAYLSVENEVAAKRRRHRRRQPA
jgi:hypothetical protein